MVRVDTTSTALTRVVVRSRNRPQPSELYVLDLSDRPFDLLWLLLMVSHVICFAFLVLMVNLYWFLGDPLMAYYASFLDPANIPNLRPFAVLYAVIAFDHVRLMTRAALASWRSRALAFSTSSSTQAVPSAMSVPPTSARQLRTVATAIQLLWIPLRAIVQVVTVVLRALFSIRSPFFHVAFLFREAIEVSAQVFQVYQASNLLGSVNINRALVVALVLNCWSTPLVHWLLHTQDKSDRRRVLVGKLVCLAVDMVLDGVNCIVLPVMVLVPYWRVFNFAEYQFPVPYMYDDVFFTRLVNEIQVVVTGSVSSVLAKLIPHVGMLACFRMIEQVVRRRSRKMMARSRSTRVHCWGPTEAATVVMDSTSHPKTSLEAISNVAVNASFGLVGLIVLALHVATAIQSSTRPEVSLCSLTMAPWLAAKFPCAVYTVDCVALNCVTPGADSLDFLDPQTLVTINFANCAALVVPAAIQRFHNLVGINVKNVTLVEWSRDAAITPELHPAMLFICLSYIHLTAIPEGMLGPLPALLQDIEISRSNLTAIPEDLYQHWPDVVVLYFEFSGIVDVPPSLMLINIFDLSLIGNNITNASALTDLPAGIGYVGLDHNPLTTLPTTLTYADGIDMYLFGAEGTLVAELPEWTQSKVENVFMFNTPFCAAANETMTAICDSSYFRSAGRYLTD